MKVYSPAASVRSDFAYTCDCCEVDDGRPVLLWEPLSDREGHFALCLECLTQLYLEHNLAATEAINIVVKRTIIPESLRNEVFERDGYRCVLCGSTESLQLDHVIPFSKGGKTDKDNLQTLCRVCNLKKGAKHG
jgi:hypothetical protein